MRLSRPCYDKMHRCPGWAGGGVCFARGESRCDNGHLRPLRGGTGDKIYAGRLRRLRFNRCDTCDVVTLPYVIRYVDPRNLWSVARRNVRTFGEFVRDVVGRTLLCPRGRHKVVSFGLVGITRRSRWYKRCGQELAPQL